MLKIQDMKDLMQTPAVQDRGLRFILTMLKGLETDKKLTPQDQVAYLEELNTFSETMYGILEDKPELEKWPAVQEKMIQFIRTHHLLDVETQQGRTVFHFINGLDGAYLAERLSDTNAMRMYAKKDSSGNDVFADKDGVETWALLNILMTKNRLTFLKNNAHLLNKVDFLGIEDVLNDFSMKQINELVTHKPDGEQSIWEQFSDTKRQEVMIYVTKYHDKEWKGPVIKWTGPDRGNSMDNGRSRV